MTIKMIAWDLGGVLDPDAGRMLRQYFPRTKPRRTAFRQLMLGHIAEPEFWGRYLVGSQWEGRLDAWLDELRLHQQPIDPALLRLYDRLSARGITHGIITNNCVFWTRAALEKIGRHFDPVIISAAIHVLKPYPKIFLEFLQISGRRPEDVLLIDDKRQNVAGAKAVGMRGIVFKSVEQLERDMEDLLHDRGH